MSTKSALPTNGGDVENSLVHGVEAAVVGAHHTVDKVGNVATHAAESLGHKGDDINAARIKLIDRASEYMREHPVASLGIAVASGYILSMIWSRK